jgi:methylated-DNA-protein-cysteine methyltransferase-like protein
MNSFFKDVYTVVSQIPYGKVVSYGQVAKMLGRPRAAREVGWAMSCCPSDDLPWWRVVKADGTVAGGQYAEVRRGILEEEGVDFLMDGRVDMKTCNVIDFEFSFDDMENIGG